VAGPPLPGEIFKTSLLPSSRKGKGGEERKDARAWARFTPALNSFTSPTPKKGRGCIRHHEPGRVKKSVNPCPSPGCQEKKEGEKEGGGGGKRFAPTSFKPKDSFLLLYFRMKKKGKSLVLAYSLAISLEKTLPLSSIDPV